VLFLMLKAYNKATGSQAAPPPTAEVALLTAIHEELTTIRQQGSAK